MNTMEKESERKHMSIPQKQWLVQKMESDNILLSGKFSNLEGRKTYKEKWEFLAEELNQLPGPQKNAEKWQKAWTDLKSKIKKRKSTEKKYNEGTGGGPSQPSKLSDLDHRIISLMGSETVEGLLDVLEPGIPTTSQQAMESSVKMGKYSEENLQAAVEAVRSGTLTQNRAAKQFSVPRSTLQFRLGPNFTKSSRGPATVLTAEEEATLVSWIKSCSKKGFPRRRMDLLGSVKCFLENNPDRSSPFPNSTPGKGWYRAFLKRHPEITYRTPEPVTSASANVSEKDIRKWFLNIEEVLKEENHFDILKDPERVFNGDETNFLLCPKGSKVLAPKGCKSVLEVDRGQAKSALTVMFSFSAAGKMVPPMIIYPYQRIPKEVMNSVPDQWSIGRSDSGWMKGETFYEYIGNTFLPYVVENNIPRPVILFVDGHKSHLTLQTSELCSRAGIVLVALYPNSTRILQPADVSAFYPIKTGWYKAVHKWSFENPKKLITKDSFAPLLELVLKNSLSSDSLKSGFRACGLFPWDPNSINFSKCLGKKNEETVNVPPKSLTFDEFQQLVGPEIMTFMSNLRANQRSGMDMGPNISSMSREQEALYDIFSFFYEPANNETVPCADEDANQSLSIPNLSTVNLSNEDMNNCLLLDVDDELLDVFGMSSLSGPFLNPIVEEVELVGDKDVQSVEENSEITGITTSNESAPPKFDHKVSDSKIMKDITSLQMEPSSSQTNQPTTPTINTPNKEITVSPLEEILVWPITPQRKGKRNSQRVPYVVSSKRWKALFNEKEEKKAEQFKQKNERKRAREEKCLNNNMLKSKVSKKSKIPSKQYVKKSKENIETQKDEQFPCHGSLCFKCAKNIKGKGKFCSKCRVKFHNECINLDESGEYFCNKCSN